MNRALATLVALTALRFDGARFPVGAVVPVTGDEAKRLIERGWIQPVPDVDLPDAATIAEPGDPGDRLALITRAVEAMGDEDITLQGEVTTEGLAVLAAATGFDVTAEDYAAAMAVLDGDGAAAMLDHAADLVLADLIEQLAKDAFKQDGAPRAATLRFLSDRLGRSVTEDDVGRVAVAAG